MCETNPISSGRPGMDAGGRETPPGSDCAKQSQFLREQQEEQVLCGKGVMVNRTCNRLRQNKANSWRARYPTIPVFHRSNIPVLSLLCETNPISAMRRGTGIPSASLSGQALPVVRNHGQDAHATATPDGLATSLPETWANLAKQTQFARRGRVGRGLGDPGRGVLYKQTQFLPLCRSGDRRSREGKSCETKPILRLRIADSGQPCGGTPLRAAGPGPVVQTNPIWRGQMCETNPIWLVGRRPGEGNAQNEPNSGPAGRDAAWRTRDERAKQSQFPGGAGWGEAPGAWDAGQMRKTNPIPGGRDTRPSNIPHHSTILFQHSNPMPMVRNEAIVVRQSSLSSCYIGVRRSHPNQDHGQSLP
jgi:hypothetical protein